MIISDETLERIGKVIAKAVKDSVDFPEIAEMALREFSDCASLDDLDEIQAATLDNR